MLYQVPTHPKIYHILHLDRLSSVLADNGLWCDAEMQKRSGTGTNIGINTIKQRRLALPVSCYHGDHVGDYVPFYFCPRSVMLYIIHMANHPDLSYRQGQEPILHLQADLGSVITWAKAHNTRWTFTLSNAGAVYTQFRSQIKHLNEINWPAVSTQQWRSADLKEGKQAEFLFYNFFPWELVEYIGVYSEAIKQRSIQILQASKHCPHVSQQPDWYY